MFGKMKRKFKEKLVVFPTFIYNKFAEHLKTWTVSMGSEMNKEFGPSLYEGASQLKFTREASST